MSIGVPKELKEECKALLTNGLAHNGLIEEPTAKDMQWANLQLAAIGFLKDKGAVQELETGLYRITAVGREYADELLSPKKYWYRRNWFPATVAVATILFSAVAATANIVNLVV